MVVVVAGGDDGSIRVWTMEGGPNFKVSATMEGHTRGVTALLVVSQGGETMLFSASEDGTIRAWNVQVGGRGLLLAAAHDDRMRHCDELL